MKGIIRTIAKIEIPIWFHNFWTLDQSKQFKNVALSRGGKTRSTSTDDHAFIESIDFINPTTSILVETTCSLQP